MSISQKDMAERYGVPFGTYRRYEAGQTAPPLDFVAKFSEEGYSLEWLLTGSGPKKIPDHILNPEPGPEHEDPGLEELLEPKGRGEYQITEAEARELRNIAKGRRSDSTTKQWITVLYTLRSLDS